MTDETAKQAKQTELSERLAVLKKNKAFIVGSSITNNLGFDANAIAITTRCAIPPDN